MFAKLTVEVHMKLYAQETENNNNIGKIYPVIDNSTSCRNICSCSSPDEIRKYLLRLILTLSSILGPSRQHLKYVNIDLDCNLH